MDEQQTAAEAPLDLSGITLADLDRLGDTVLADHVRRVLADADRDPRPVTLYDQRT